MKKYLILLAAALMLTSCGGSTVDTEEEPTAEATVAATEAAATTEPINIDDVIAEYEATGEAADDETAIAVAESALLEWESLAEDITAAIEDGTLTITYDDGMSTKDDLMESINDDEDWSEMQDFQVIIAEEISTALVSVGRDDLSVDLSWVDCDDDSSVIIQVNNGEVVSE